MVSDPENAPVFYKPKEILWTNLWLNRVAIAAIVVTVLVSIPEIIRMQRIVLSYFMGDVEWSFVSLVNCISYKWFGNSTSVFHRLFFLEGIGLDSKNSDGDGI